MKQASPRSPRSFPLRWHLVALVVGTLLPLVLFATGVVVRLANEQRASALRRLSHSARLMGEAVEQEFASTIRALQALAESDRLDRGDLAGFWAEAGRVQRTQTNWLTILLCGPDGQVYLNTTRPFGTRLPPVAELESLKRLVRSGAPTIGNLARGKMVGRWAFPLRVPVRRGGKLKYVLTAVITPKALTQTVARQLPPGEEWTRTLLDHENVIVARTRDPERYIGHAATPRFIRLLNATGEGIDRNTSVDGVSIYAAYCRTRQANWTSIVTAPVGAVDGPVGTSLLIISGVGIAVLVVSGAGAYVLSRHVARGIGSASRAATALAHGRRPATIPTSVTEIAQLAEALDRSAQLLAQRAAERDEQYTQAVAARAEAEAANRTKDEFLAMLGHELRNPLAPIVTALEVLQLRGLADGKEWEVIDRQTRHMAALVDDLMDVSRITRGTIELELVPVEMAEVVAQSVEMAAPLITERRHELKVEVPESGLLMPGDLQRLKQVVTNLLTNAARYTPVGGLIEVHARAAGEWVELTVCDNGQGMSPELLARAFDVFVQGSRPQDRRLGGLGLGLSIVQNLVRLHGGTVSAASEGPGQGSTLTVRLPAYRNEPHPG